MKRVLMGTAVILLVAGCGGSSAVQHSAPLKTTTLPTASPADAPSAADLVTRVGLFTRDLANGYQVRLIPGGDRVTGQVTLHDCGYDFTTEKDRVARRQTAIVTAAGVQSGLSNEVVAYDTRAHAAEALRQFRTSVKHCPKNVFEDSGNTGGPDVRYDVSSIGRDVSLPVKDNAVARFVVTFKGVKGQVHGSFILQRQGTVLDAVYLQTRTNPTASDLSVLRSLAQTTGVRLAAT
jgi:hypothetical protein